jgi:molybdopterin/thiamine biosynthesis adenylyltransferase
MDRIMDRSEEAKRYSRQIPILGEEGQEKIREARVLIAGAGGLGSVIALYLAAAGVGFIRLVDHDRVETSNLNRQILHWTEDVNRPKTASAQEKLQALNPHIGLEIRSGSIDEGSVSALAGDVHLIVDAMDNFPTRYLLNRAAVARRIPFFHGAVRGFYGQAATILPGKTACLRCIFPSGPPAETFPIVGATCGVIGSIQATEVIKYLSGKGSLLTKLLFWDGLRGEMDGIDIFRNPDCSDCGRSIVGGCRT